LTATYSIELEYNEDPGAGKTRLSKAHTLDLVLNPRVCNKTNAELSVDKNACVCKKGYYGAWGSTCTKCEGESGTTLTNGAKLKTECIGEACPTNSSTMLFCEYENSTKQVLESVLEPQNTTVSTLTVNKTTNATTVVNTTVTSQVSVMKNVTKVCRFRYPAQTLYFASCNPLCAGRASSPSTLSERLSLFFTGLVRGI
jgi:hypothetical protein